MSSGVPRRSSGAPPAICAIVCSSLPSKNRGGGGRPGGDGVDGDVAAAQLAGQDQGHRLDRALGGGVRAVAGQRQAGYGAGEVDDRAAVAQPARGLLVDDERPADVGAVHAVQGVQVDVRQRGEWHDAGRVHDDVDAAVGLLGEVEELRRPPPRRPRRRARRSACPPAAVIAGHASSARLVARVVHDDGEAVRSQPLGAARPIPPDPPVMRATRPGLSVMTCCLR